ncbi:MAG TPA: nuclear transport factor 2 family protein [Thermoplasmata archaeon]|nr:nuclear transport factor 2 family protein [Thermoplasmata archaeon]
MPEGDTVRTALKFVNEINRHDIDSILALIADDYLFTDSLGQEVRGKERAREGWAAYLALFPDYHIGIKEWFQNGRVVSLVGVASGTYAVRGTLPSENRWKTPAAWRVVVRDNQVVQWQVFADQEPVWKVMGVKRT